MPRRLVLDLSMILRWTGPPVGIARVEAEFARFALTRPDVGFVFFDTRAGVFRKVEPDLVRQLLDGTVSVDMTGMPDPRPVARGPVAGFLHRFDRRLTAIRRPRPFAVRKLEDIRARLAPGRTRGAVERLQEWLFTPKYRRFFFNEDGGRRTFAAADQILGPPVSPGPDTVILSAGADWNTKNPDRMRALKRQRGWRLVMATYDLIPIDMPLYFPARDVAVVTNYFREAASFVDRFICISEATARDLRNFAEREGLKLSDVQVEPLGANPSTEAAGDLPRGLEPRRFALYVSTLEPRKNHMLLLRAWSRLNRQGIPARTGFKLVFVGRIGWDTEAVVAALTASESVVHLDNVRDPVLSRLYEQAAFCLYPSIYEGYGLPIVEAFLHGRAVIASTGGAIPEVTQGLGPCLDPRDEGAWTATIAEWIAEPAVVAAHEARIAAEFRPVTWQESAERYFRQALGVFDGPGQSR